VTPPLRPHAHRLLAAAALALCSSEPLRAQQPRVGIAPEVRVDVLGGSGTSVQAGAGIQIPAGTYVRVGVIGGLGSRWQDGESRADGRLDVLARFLIDPFRQSRWGISAGGGVSLRALDGDRIRPHVLLAIDVEGPRSGSGLSPAFQLGLGGGVRGGVGLRWGGRAAR
jgi:hypothetical protein